VARDGYMDITLEAADKLALDALREGGVRERRLAQIVRALVKRIQLANHTIEIKP
jgi:hypothetical protein